VSTTVILKSFEICDFCSKRPVVMTVVTHSFILPVPSGLVNPPTIMSADNWKACRECGGFVERGDWDGLRDRVVQMFDTSFSRLPFDPTPVVKELYIKLRENMIGFNWEKEENEQRSSEGQQH
jgi:hypothetical protein